MDYQYLLTNTDSIDGQFAYSSTENPDMLVENFGLPQKQQDNAFQLGYRTSCPKLVLERHGSEYW